MSTCQERVIFSPQEGVGLDSMAPCSLFQLCDSDSDSDNCCETCFDLSLISAVGVSG